MTEAQMLSSILYKINKFFILLFAVILTTNSYAAITDGKFSINQIFDVQYFWNGNTLNASNFIAPYDKNFQTVTATAGQYFEFFPSTTNPGKYGLRLMNSDGSFNKVIHDFGDITALSSDAIFYVGSGFFGNVITPSEGFSYGSSATFENMNRAVTQADLDGYTYASTEPLAAGQTAASAPSSPPPAPTPVYTSAITTQQSNRKAAVLANTNGNQADVIIQGNSNLVTIEQIGPGHYSGVDIVGNTNTVSVNQHSLTDRHYSELTIEGTRNSVNIIQQEGGKNSFAIILGNDNTAIIEQKGSGNHYANLEIVGNNHRALISQNGSGIHNASVSISGSQPWNFELYQDGNTGRTYSLPHGMTDGATVSGHCATVGGCSIIINQN
jgi:hypothetical protein